jgi:hypothetical protein
MGAFQRSRDRQSGGPAFFYVLHEIEIVRQAVLDADAIK